MTTALPGDEGRRQAYLAALGIPLWSARRVLPGALPAPPLEVVPFVAGTGPEPVAESLPIAQAAPAGVREQPPAVAPAAAPAAAPARAAAPAPAASPGIGGAREAGSASPGLPRLACRVQPLGRGVTAVIALDDAPDLSGSEYQLLASIARALGAEDLPGGGGEPLRWPLNRNPALDHGEAAMHAWLGHALRLPPGGVLVFGEALAAHVRSALPAQRLRSAPTLAEMLADAGAKRRLLAVLADVLPAPVADHG